MMKGLWTSKCGQVITVCVKESELKMFNKGFLCLEKVIFQFFLLFFLCYGIFSPTPQFPSSVLFLSIENLLTKFQFVCCCGDMSPQRAADGCTILSSFEALIQVLLL
ncbi:unnamed protein product [Lathyrus sativus]|nr:unnamed protein product [Lathyrus sativus]